MERAPAAADRQDDRRYIVRERGELGVVRGRWSIALADGRRPASEKRKIIYTRENGSPNFQSHHQPFNYHARFAPGTADRAGHLKDGEDFLRDLDAGMLPA